jgi:arylsulfatase A-like enzyme
MIARLSPLLFVVATVACSTEPPPPPPNVLFIVWDTTRADRTSVHGYEKPTTPFLAEWAKDARVFDNCIAVGSSTVPSHGGMFTGKLPSEHGANNTFPVLDGRHVTLAELFQGAGYRTYSFTENPHISIAKNFVQGFDVSEHPWDEKYKERAFAIIEEKIDPKDKSSEMLAKIRRARRRAEKLGAELDEELNDWQLKAAGELAEEGLIDWLDSTPAQRPFFAFLNYMEAHRPFVPPMRCREAFMDDDQIALSFAADRSWPTMWSYTLGMHEYSPEDLEVMALTYDACVLELDQLFQSMIEALDAKGYLDNTIVVLTGDHGEHLGEHHMLDHQYSLYQGLVHVPMVLWYPPKVTPGRVEHPVQNYDVFPTLLELARLDPPAGLRSRAVNLLEADAQRKRIAEYPSPFDNGIKTVEKRYGAAFNPQPFRRTLRALYDGCDKLIVGSDGRRELYDLCEDVGETNELTNVQSPSAETLGRELGHELDRVVGSLTLFDPDGVELPPMDEMSPLQIRMLQGLGYIDGEDDEEPEAPAPPR